MAVAHDDDASAGGASVDELLASIREIMNEPPLAGRKQAVAAAPTRGRFLPSRSAGLPGNPVPVKTSAPRIDTSGGPAGQRSSHDDVLDDLLAPEIAIGSRPAVARHAASPPSSARIASAQAEKIRSVEDALGALQVGLAAFAIKSERPPEMALSRDPALLLQATLAALRLTHAVKNDAVWAVTQASTPDGKPVELPSPIELRGDAEESKTTAASAASVSSARPSGPAEPKGTQALVPGRGTELALANQTFENAIASMLRPLLREWLDAHLPRLVEKALREELREELGEGSVLGADQSTAPRHGGTGRASAA